MLELQREAAVKDLPAAIERPGILKHDISSGGESI